MPMDDIITLKYGTGRREYFATDQQKSAPLKLEKGKKYHIKVKNGGEGHMAVALEVK